MNSRPLSPEELAILQRFNKWLDKIFFKSARALFPSAGLPPFSTTVSPDKHGHLMIDNGRMILAPPVEPWGEWRVTLLENQTVITDASLEEILLRSLNQALRRSFVEKY